MLGDAQERARRIPPTISSLRVRCLNTLTRQRVRGSGSASLTAGDDLTHLWLRFLDRSVNASRCVPPRCALGRRFSTSGPRSRDPDQHRMIHAETAEPFSTLRDASSDAVHFPALCDDSIRTRPDPIAGRFTRSPRLPRLNPSRIVPSTVTRAPLRGTPCRTPPRAGRTRHRAGRRHDWRTSSCRRPSRTRGPGGPCSETDPQGSG